MIAALSSFLSVQSALQSPRETLPQWVSPSVRRGDEVIYMSGPDGLYVYRRHPAFELVAFVLLGQNVTTAGPALGPNGDLYIVNFGNSPSASVVDEFRHDGRRFRLVRQYSQADYGIDVTVGPDASVYVVGIEGEVLQWSAAGGVPVRALYSRKEFDAPTGVAVDAQGHVFVSYQFEPSGLGALRGGVRLPPGGVSGCHRRSGEIDEFGPTSKRSHCVNSTLATHLPGSLAFDAAGNLVVANSRRANAGDITVLAPPTWDVSHVVPLPQAPTALAFGAPNHIYFLDQSSHVVERSYPDGAIIGAWWLHQPWANGMAVGTW
jgi:hypothetical protein